MVDRSAGLYQSHPSHRLSRLSTYGWHAPGPWPPGAPSQPATPSTTCPPSDRVSPRLAAAGEEDVVGEPTLRRNPSTSSFKPNRQLSVIAAAVPEAGLADRRRRAADDDDQECFIYRARPQSMAYDAAARREDQSGDTTSFAGPDHRWSAMGLGSPRAHNPAEDDPLGRRVVSSPHGHLSPHAGPSRGPDGGAPVPAPFNPRGPNRRSKYISSVFYGSADDLAETLPL
ncbi:hypothetical protein IWQ60_012554, partial [Tieghemiomyces parasiticus]